MLRLRLFLVLAAAVAVVATIVLPAVAGLGTRFSLWDFRFGLGTLSTEWWPVVRYASMGLGAITLLSGLVVRPLAVISVFVGVAALAVPVAMKVQSDRTIAYARSVPPIHDITTDTEDPPMFTAEIIAEREETGARNTTEYDGKTALRDWTDPTSEVLVSELQKEGYPDLETIRLEVDPAVAHGRALAAARAQGWELFTNDAPNGIIEATATTFWYGFKDDIVIRVRPAPSGSMVDIRSVSRIGGGDMGANAKRIREFRDRLS